MLFISMKPLPYGCIKNLTTKRYSTKNTIKKTHMKKLLLISLLIFSSGIVIGQENKFLVYSFKGNVSITENKTESAAKIGRTLGSTAKIKVPNGGMVTLICNELAMFSIKKPGTYALTQFGDSCQVN